MAALTLSQVRTFVRALLDDDTTEHWSEATELVLINSAQRYVWKELMRADENLLGQESSFTYPADTASIDITGASYLNASPEAILLIRQTPQSGSISRSNSPWEWKPVASMGELSDLQWGWGGGTAYYTNEYQRYYYLTGDTLHVGPIPTASCNLKVTWIPQVTDLASAGDEVLNGLAQEHGEAVAYRAAWVMNAKQNGSNPMVQALWEEAAEKIRGSSRMRQGAKRVRVR